MPSDSTLEDDLDFCGSNTMLRLRRERYCPEFSSDPGSKRLRGRDTLPEADTIDTNDKILSLAAEITGEPADLKTITG